MPVSQDATVRDRLIVAIDVPTIEQARALARTLAPHCGYLKFGLGLVPIGGVALARETIEAGGRVFLDLKLFDIHNTVAEATARCAEIGVSILTLQGDPHVVRAAVAGRNGVPDARMQLFAITVLTSLTQTDVTEIGFDEPLDRLALRRARAALDAGADGVVCSAHEVATIKQATGGALRAITPGIRSAGAGAQDQKRVATPQSAIDAGADHVVVGRQITQAADPAAAARAVLDEIAQGMEARG